jgi:hypothetical protein
MAADEPRPEESHGSALSPWLKLMLAEIRRKREELEQERAEQLRRAGEANARLHNTT